MKNAVDCTVVECSGFTCEGPGISDVMVGGGAVAGVTGVCPDFDGE